ncbi:MAG: hypothetical protein ACI9BW_001020 [Gammaproteobacteria bacterium]|jgi:hypothetical protein
MAANQTDRSCGTTVSWRDLNDCQYEHVFGEVQQGRGGLFRASLIFMSHKITVHATHRLDGHGETYDGVTVLDQLERYVRSERVEESTSQFTRQTHQPDSAPRPKALGAQIVRITRKQAA